MQPKRLTDADSHSRSRGCGILHIETASIRPMPGALISRIPSRWFTLKGAQDLQYKRQKPWVTEGRGEAEAGRESSTEMALSGAGLIIDLTRKVRIPARSGAHIARLNSTPQQR